MIWMLAASAAMNAMSAASGYKAAKAQSKADRAMQAYRNTMTNLSNAVSQNGITTNELLSSAALARQGVEMKRQGMLTSAQGEVTAAAAGVKGSSVNQVLRNIQANSARNERERQITLERSYLSFDQSRLNSQLQAVMQQDLTHIPKPKASSFFLDAAMKTMSTGMSLYGGGSTGSGGGLGGDINFAAAKSGAFNYDGGWGG